MDEQKDGLPFHPRKQQAILGHLLSNSKFFEQARHRVESEWFDDPRCAKVYSIMLRHIEVSSTKRPPTVDEVRFGRFINEELPPEQTSLRTAISSALMETTNFPLDALRIELTEWMHARIFRDQAARSVAEYNNKRFHQAYTIASEGIKKIADTSFEEDTEIDFLDFEHYLADSKKQYQDALTTGFKMFDDAMVPDGNSQGGGLFRKDTTIFLAPANIGKSTTLITIARHNVMAHKNVLYMTHEGRPEDIREKILCSILRVSKPVLFKMYDTPSTRHLLDMTVKMLNEHFTYVPYNKAGMTVEDVIPIIRRRQEQRLSKTGNGYDMLISDYPAKLSTKQAFGGHLARRHIDDIVYENYVQLALELDIHCLLAIQTNRQGSKDNRDATRLLTMEDANEAFGPMQSATNVVSINRDIRARKANRLTYYIAKSRSSETGTAIVCKSNFAASLAHDETLGGIRYMGTDPMSDKIDDLLRDYNGKAVPEHMFYATSA